MIRQLLDILIAWVGDGILLLRQLTSSPLGSVEHVSLGDSLSLDEIDDIVHEVRRQRREV